MDDPELPSKDEGLIDYGCEGIFTRTGAKIRNLTRLLAFLELDRFRKGAEGLIELKLSEAERIRLTDICLRYGLGTKVEVSLSDPDVFRIVGEVAGRHLTAPQYEAFRAELDGRLGSATD